MQIAIRVCVLSLMFILLLADLAGAPPCPKGDLNDDCKVTFTDLQLFAERWLDPNCAAPGCKFDLDSIPGVSLTDFAQLAGSWLEDYSKITLVINEFMARNNSDSGIRDEYGDYDDWIEIYNYGSEAVNIGGMWLTDDINVPARWQVPMDNPAATTIAAGGFLLIWADSEAGEGTLHAGFGLSYSREDVGLFDRNGNFIDGIAFRDQQLNKSYGRLPDGSSNWQVFDNPTPWKSNGIPRPKIIINEIMYYPYSAAIQAEDLRQEYIELFNQGAEAVHLAGWRFSNGVDFNLPDRTIGSGEYLVVAADVNAFKNKYPAVSNVIGGWSGHLSNSGEEVELVDQMGVRIDQVHYADDGDWAVRQLGPLDYFHRGWEWSDQHDGGGKSLELINPALSNEYGQNWAASVSNEGTPGRINSVTAGNIAPIIVDVVHTPIIPRPSDLVTVTARIIDELASGITVTLHYSVDSSAYNNQNTYPHYVAGDYNNLTMFDDGAHSDGAAGDGIYGAQIPAHKDGTIIEFFIRARDAGANTRTWPASSVVDGTPEQVTNALYQVDDSYDPNAHWVPGSQPIYYIIMTEMERGRLEDIGDDGDPFTGEGATDAQMNATFISVDGVDIKARYHVGVRNRGNRTRVDPPMNYRVNFPHDSPWKDITALNINSKYPHLQLMGSTLFQMAGLAAPNATVVQVRINGENLAASDYGRTYNSYVALEAFDSDWAGNHFPDDDAGNLYRCTYVVLPGGDRTFADLYYKETPGQIPDPDDYRDNYTKETNVAVDDYSDLFKLIDKLNNPGIPDANFIAEVSKVLNLEKWMRYIATDALAGNREGGLYEGEGDDYAMYCGIEDPRFWPLPHDMDTLLGQGDHDYQPQRDIFGYAGVEGLKRLFGNPDALKLYYSRYQNLINTAFAPENIYPLIDQRLADWVPQSEIEGSNGIKQFVVERAKSILYGGYPSAESASQIPQTFTINCSLTMVNGFYQTNTNKVSLNGTANAIETRSVKVNGQPATWSQRYGTWSISNIALNPGINRIVVQTFGGPNGSGDEFENRYIDIWYNDGNVTDISGTLTSNTVLNASSGPWRVTGIVTVPAAVTLTIEPGTTIFFEPNTKIVINGRLVAEGMEYRFIRFTRTPGTSGIWNGLQFANTVRDNRITYAVLEYGQTDDGMIGMANSSVLLDHLTLDNTILNRIRTENSSLVLRHSIFTDTVPPGQPPTDNRTEHIWGTGVPVGGQFIIENNVFGRTPGHNDAIDFDGPSRPNPIPQILNNVFLGGGDDALDLETDAHVEGNVFANYIKDEYNTASGESNVISAGGGRHYVIVRNIFRNAQHVAQVKNDAFLTFVNNTVVDACEAAIYFDLGLPGREPGRGAYVDGTIFWDTPEIFAGIVVTTELTVNRSIVPLQWHYLGGGNIDADPLFVDPNSDLHIKPMSPAIGTGPCGLDMGAYVPAGAAVCGEPDAVTYRTQATVTVDGPGITHYKYRFKDNDSLSDWSGEFDVNTPVILTSLQNGHSYTVYATGKNSAGIWQTDPCCATSRTWRVDTSFSKLVINEILAHTHGSDPDLIELYYDGPPGSWIDLTGKALTDDAAEPNKFVFSSDTVITTIMHPGDYMVLYGDLNTHLQNHIGFALYSEGEALYLYDKPISGIRHLIDSVVHGPQINDYSIGRVGYSSVWRLNKPTFGYANVVQPLGDPYKLKINEWLANEEVMFEEDFIELYNPCDLPVDLSELYLTENPVTQPAKQKLGPLSFIPAKSYAVFIADDVNNPGHLDFKLSSDGEIIGLFDAQLNEIDKVLYGPQTTNVSQGRSQDGSKHFEFFELPTPHVANAVTETMIRTIVAESAAKKVLVPTAAVSEDWKGGNEPFNDSGWNSATYISGKTGGVGYDATQTLYDPYISYDVETKMYSPGQNDTCYIRIPFTVEPNYIGNITDMTVGVKYDDGFIVYLNGVKIAEKYAPALPQWNSGATGTHSDSLAVNFENFTVSAYIEELKPGQNILAIHGLNQSGNRSDFLISVELVITVTMSQNHPIEKLMSLVDGLRITEIMYHDPNGSNFDYIELKNITDAPLDLNGVRFTEGIEFTFPQMTLDIGRYVVVVAHLPSFESRYGTAGITIAGDYSGNLSNGGEDILLQLPWPYEAAIMRFGYNDTWYPTTDGGGYSLVIRDETAEPKSWDEPEGWQASYPSPGKP